MAFNPLLPKSEQNTKYKTMIASTYKKIQVFASQQQHFYVARKKRIFILFCKSKKCLIMLNFLISLGFVFIHNLA